MAQFPHGTTLTIDGVVVAELRELNTDHEGEELDVTTHDSSFWKEFLLGLREATIELTGLYQPPDPGQQDLYDALDAGTVVAFVITYPNGYGRSGNAIITAFGETGPYDNVSDLAVTMRVTGEPSLVSPS
jgi:predicted secreted protein